MKTEINDTDATKKNFQSFNSQWDSGKYKRIIMKQGWKKNQFQMYTLTKENNSRKQKKSKWEKQREKALEGRASQMRHFNEI